MKNITWLILFVLAFQSNEAQEKYIDSLYGIEEVKTEVYAEKDQEKLIIDLYMPEKNGEEKLPLIIFMHGGGFAGGNPKNPRKRNLQK